MVISRFYFIFPCHNKRKLILVWIPRWFHKLLLQLYHQSRMLHQMPVHFSNKCSVFYRLVCFRGYGIRYYITIVLLSYMTFNSLTYILLISRIMLFPWWSNFAPVNNQISVLSLIINFFFLTEKEVTRFPCFS